MSQFEAMKKLGTQGLKLCEDGRFQDALPKLQSASKSFPDNETLEISIGVCFFMLERRVDAIDHLTKIRGIFPNNHLGYALLMGSVLYQDERYAEAIPHLERARRLVSCDSKFPI